MQCSELMKPHPATVKAEDSAQVAASRMRDEGIGFLPVCDADGTVLGAVTDRDITTRVVAAGLPGTVPVGSFMTRETIACRPEDDVREVERKMSLAQVSRVMVIDPNSDRLLGVISLSDVSQLETGGRATRTLVEVSSREARP